jgi:hypothetical protein
MPDQSIASPGEAETTDVRFSLRSLLIVTVVVAVTAALLGPYIRNLSPDERAPVGAMWAVCITMAAAAIGYQARLRYRLERDAGKRLISLPLHGKKLGANASNSLYVIGGLAIACGVLYLLGENVAFHLRQNRPSAISSLVFAILLRAGLSAMFMVYGISIIWWGRSVQLREHGALRGLHLLRWDHVTNCHWSRWSNSLYLEGVDQRHRDIQAGISIPDRNLEMVGLILADKLPTLFNAQQIPTLSSVSTGRATFPLVTGRERTARGCFVFFVAWICGTLIAGLMGGAQSREFNYGSITGALACVVAAFIDTRQIGHAGRPQVRLNIWCDWPVLLSWAIVAGVCYYLGWVLMFTATWITVALGLACGYAFVSAVRVSALDKLDLCEHGVVVRRSWYWPWHGIHVRRWESRTNGWLELRRGWRRITAIVPNAERELVEQVLKTKLEIG